MVLCRGEKLSPQAIEESIVWGVRPRTDGYSQDSIHTTTAAEEWTLVGGLRTSHSPEAIVNRIRRARRTTTLTHFSHHLRASSDPAVPSIPAAEPGDRRQAQTAQ
jgi:hypothetical protein